MDSNRLNKIDPLLKQAKPTAITQNYVIFFSCSENCILTARLAATFPSRPIIAWYNRNTQRHTMCHYVRHIRTTHAHITGEAAAIAAQNCDGIYQRPTQLRVHNSITVCTHEIEREREWKYNKCRKNFHCTNQTVDGTIELNIYEKKWREIKISNMWRSLTVLNINFILKLKLTIFGRSRFCLC